MFEIIAGISAVMSGLLTQACISPSGLSIIDDDMITVHSSVYCGSGSPSFCLSTLEANMGCSGSRVWNNYSKLLPKVTQKAPKQQL